jgi:hypothetical protein
VPNKQWKNFHPFSIAHHQFLETACSTRLTWKNMDAQNNYLKMAPHLLSSSPLLVTEKDSNFLLLVSKQLSKSGLWFRITISPFFFWPLFYGFSYWVYGGIAFASWVLGIIDCG